MYGRIFVCRFKEFTSENSKTIKTVLIATSLISATSIACKYFKKHSKRYEKYHVEEITKERFPLNELVWIAEDIYTESKIVAREAEVL